MVSRSQSSVVVGLLLLIVLGGCSSPPDSRAVATWPEPEISALHPEVQDRLLAAQSELVFELGNHATPEVLAQKWRSYGELLQATKFYSEAIECYESSLAVKEDSEVAYLLGHSLLGQGEVSRAAVVFENILRERPQDLDCRVFLAQSYQRLGESAQASALFVDFETQDLPPLAHLILGEAALANRDDLRALAHFERVIEEQPFATRTHLLIAQGMRRLHREDEATAHLAKRGEGRVVYTDYRLNRIEELRAVAPTWLLKGGEAFNRGEYPKAEEMYRKALVEDEQNASAHLNLGSTMVATGRIEEGLRSFERALELDPENPAIYFNIGTSWAKLKDDFRALTYYDQALGIDPKYTSARYNRATARLRQGFCAEAAADFGRVYRERPNQSGAGRGEVLAQSCAGEEEDALRLVTALIQTFPLNPSLMEAKGRLLAGSSRTDLRDGEGAILLLEPLQGAGKTLEQVEAYAMALAQVGRFGEAARLQKGALAAVKQSSRGDLIAPLERNLLRYLRKETAPRPWEPEVYGASGG